MTDRVLLELAAKAAGLIIDDHLGDDLWVYPIGAPANADGEHDCALWNPLTDDGDAMRICVKLGLDVASFLGSKVTRCWVLGFANDGIKEPHGSDPYAATRRAIVRAAAEIGKAMQ